MSKVFQILIKVSFKEIFDFDGVFDLGKQMSYSLVEGLIYKYEFGLIYVVLICLVYCCFCYCEELIVKKEVEWFDGMVVFKGLVQVGDIVIYIECYNCEVIENGECYLVIKCEKLCEIFMLGGDFLVLVNCQIVIWFCVFVGVGIENICIGIKELVFYLDWIDEGFVKMFDGFYELYFEVVFWIMVYFNYLDEFFVKDVLGIYIKIVGGSYKWFENIYMVVIWLWSCSWIMIENQVLIIKGINDDLIVLCILQCELKCNGVGNYYFFCGCDIVGYKVFNILIEEVWQIFNEFQKGLLGVEVYVWLLIMYYKGKIEVVVVIDKLISGFLGVENGVVVLKLFCFVELVFEWCKVMIVGCNFEVVWFSGYDDCVLFDEVGLYLIYNILLLLEQE